MFGNIVYAKILPYYSRKLLSNYNDSFALRDKIKNGANISS